MIFDALQTFAEDLAAGASNEVDFGVPEVGRGEPIEIVFIGTGLTTAGTIEIQLQSANVTGGPYTTNLSVPGLSAAEANTAMKLTVPVGTGMEQFAIINIVGATGGTFDAFVVPRGGVQQNP